MVDSADVATRPEPYSGTADDGSEDVRPHGVPAGPEDSPEGGKVHGVTPLKAWVTRGAMDSTTRQRGLSPPRDGVVVHDVQDCGQRSNVEVLTATDRGPSGIVKS